MRRLIAAAVFGVGTMGALGCAGSATVVQKSPDGTGAVIALKAGGDPTEAHKMAAKTLGGEVAIVETIQPSMQQGAFDPANPNAGPKTDPGVTHYIFKLKGKTNTNVAGLPPAPGVGTGVGMAGAGMGMPAGTGMAGAGTGMPGGAGMPAATAPGTPGWMGQVSGTGRPGTGAVPAGGSGFGTMSDAGAPPAMFPSSK